MPLSANASADRAASVQRHRPVRLVGCTASAMMLFGVVTAGPACSQLLPGATIALPALGNSAIDGGPLASAQRQGNRLSLDLSLADAVALGLRSNRNIRRSYLLRVAQKFDLHVAEGFFSPRLLLSGKHLARRGSQEREQQLSVGPKIMLYTESGAQLGFSWTQHFNQADQTGRRQQRGLSFEIIQPLLRGAGEDIVTAPRRRARLSEHSHRLGLQAAVAQSVTQIISAYRELLKAQEQLRIVIQALGRSHEQMMVNDALIAAGRMAQVDRLQNEADLAYQELNAEQAAHQLEASRRALLQRLSLDLSTPVRASDELTAKPAGIDVQQALNIALQRQPRYLQQRIAEELVDIDLLVAKNQQLWDLSLVAGAEHDRKNFASRSQEGVERRWNSYAGVQLEIPIGDPVPRQRLVNAQVAVDTQALEQAQTRQSLEREVSDAVRILQAQWRQYEIAQRSLSLSQRKLSVERQKLHAGRTSNFQVLSFEEDLRRSENAVLNALIGYLDAQTQLDERLGTTLDTWEIALND